MYNMECQKRTESYVAAPLVIIFLASLIIVIADPVRFDITGKETKQSSNYDNKFFSSKAVDGCKDDVMDNDCCTHTDPNKGPGWWTVDIGETVIVNSVTITNRVKHQQRLAQFTIFGSNESYSNSVPGTECVYRRDTVGNSVNLRCDSPVMARYVNIVKKQRDRKDDHILTLCEVEIEVCPANTYGVQCQQCGQCQIAQCDWTSETGVCFGECSAGYKGDNCKAECDDKTYGIGCKPCSQNCKNSMCRKLLDTMNCLDGCIPGKSGTDCSEECPDKTYGYGCLDCSKNCIESKCEKFSSAMTCTNGCIAGYMGPDCSTDCPDKTYGYGCLDCSENCLESNCEKFSSAMTCTNGCIAGYMGPDCSQECPDGTYGIGCELCSSTCFDSRCDKFSDTLNCTDGCIAGYTGMDCSTECPNGTYGYGCFNCSEHCVNSSCDKFSENGVCLAGCEVGYTMENCNEECPDSTYGPECEPCSPNCKNLCDKFSATGVCTEGCVTGYTGETCLEYQISGTENKSGTTVGATAGAVVAALVIAIVIVAVVIVFLRRRNHNETKAEGSMDLRSAANIYSVPIDDTDAKAGKMERPTVAHKPSHILLSESSTKVNKEISLVTNDRDAGLLAFEDNETEYVNVGAMAIPQSSKRILVKDLRQRVEVMKSGTNIYKNEYEDIPQTTSSTTEANKPELKFKNRYKNVVPYNHNRVHLRVQNQDPLTDYINASFIKDYQGKVSYIAALGSTKVTLPDTWRMIWEHEIKSIFMVTNLTENEKIKCEQYWPSEGLQTYGENTVILEEENVDPHIVIRKLKITQARKHRIVTHYHYTSWPDKQPPLSVTSVVKLRSYLKEERLKHSSPVLVHCSAGIGRTGTLIALDILLDQMDAEGAVDIKQCVHTLRHQRTQMVQTLVQYKFIYECLNEISTLGSTVVALSNLPTFLNSDEYMQRTQKEYQFLETVKPVFTDAETEIGRTDYKDKNRDSRIIPSMNQRVKLSLFPKIYINAVYVRGYEGPQQFCATQWPLESTTVDFWQVILQEKSAAMVCLENNIDEGKWFSSQNLSASYDDITVSAICITDNTDTQEYDITIQQHEATDLLDGAVEYANLSSIDESNTHKLKMVVLKSLTPMEIGKRNASLIPAIYKQVQSIVQKTSRYGVTVTCRNGTDETGLYIGASILFDMINKEQQVDVVQAVKQIRKTRPEFITSQEQYRWLYNVCAAYLEEMQ